MKINVFGNILNWGLGFGMLLRRAGHDARVFINRKEMAFYQPEWELPDFSLERYPFVEFVELDNRRLLWPGRNERDFLRRLAECDVIQTFGEYSLWAAAAGKPYVVLSYGFDLETMAFAAGSLKLLALRTMLRRAFRGAARFVYATPKDSPLVARLGLKNAVLDPHLVPLDTERFAPRAPEERRRLRSEWNRRLVLFHGARQEWTRGAGEHANQKGNDRLLRAFARLVREVEPDSLLIAVRKGGDLDASAALAAELGITGHIRWIEQLRKPELITMLNSVDAFCDQFAFGYYGVSTLEALSCSTPTFVYLDPAQFGGGLAPPVFNGRTADEIFSALRAFAASPDREARAAEGRRWVVEHHGWARQAEKYEVLYRGVL